MMLYILAQILGRIAGTMIAHMMSAPLLDASMKIRARGAQWFTGFHRAAGGAQNVWRAPVEQTVFQGNFTQVHVGWGRQHLVARCAAMEPRHVVVLGA
jgi:glycerol uptake facilitator-like aquaporin